MKRSGLIVLPAIFLTLLSLTMISSIAPDRLLIQTLFLIIAVFVGWGVWSVGVRNWMLLAMPAYLTVLVLFVLTILFGTMTRGSTRWLQIGSFRLQASELAKPVLLIFLTGMLSGRWPAETRDQLKKLRRLLLLVAPVMLVVLLQPDLGTAIVLGVITIVVLVLSGLPKKILISALLLAIVLLPASRFVLKDYQLRRLQAFVNPYSDPRGSGYQVIQSTIAIGSGQWMGRGLGHGTQSQLKFLPERHTDFIFASLVEELGLVGGALVLILYSTMIIGLIGAAHRVKRKESWLIISGVAIWLFFQAAVNIGMNLGLAPVTGITLPFLSAGGSSLVSSAIMIGLAVSAADV